MVWVGCVSTSREAEGSTRSVQRTGWIVFSVLPLAWGHGPDPDPGLVLLDTHRQAASTLPTSGNSPQEVGHLRCVQYLSANCLLATTPPFVVSSVGSESTLTKWREIWTKISSKIPVKVVFSPSLHTLQWLKIQTEV